MSAEMTIAPRAGRALIVADALTQESEQRKLLGEYVRSHMIEGTDYGVIPGTTNKTLLKPGAEKLTQLYRCIPRFTIEEKTENWDTGLFYYRFSCQIVTQADETVVAEGVGSCSTFESRYRWRQSNRACPHCGKESIIKGKAEFGGGWLCFKKKDGCGEKFADEDTRITNQLVGRVQNPDIIDQVNTVLKMAKKRALVDASIALARCSDIFTQDMEDHIHDDAPPVRQPPAKPAQPKPEPAKPKLPTAADENARWDISDGKTVLQNQTTSQVRAAIADCGSVDKLRLKPAGAKNEAAKPADQWGFTHVPVQPQTVTADDGQREVDLDEGDRQPEDAQVTV